MHAHECPRCKVVQPCSDKHCPVTDDRAQMLLARSNRRPCAICAAVAAAILAGPSPLQDLMAEAERLGAKDEQAGRFGRDLRVCLGWTEVEAAYLRGMKSAEKKPATTERSTLEIAQGSDR